MLTFFTGYRTKILSAIALLGAFLMDMGWITAVHWDAVVKYIIPLIALALHAAIKNASEKVETKVETVDAKVEKVEMKVAVIDDAVQERVVPAMAQVTAQVQDIKAVVQDSATPSPYRSDTPHILKP